jgi:ribosomal protein L37AE/L43A
LLKQARKKNAAKYSLPKTSAEQIVCGACNHVREETAANPDWQCPGCGAAYSKVNPEHHAEKRYSQQELGAKNREYLQKKREGNVEDSESMEGNIAAAGLTIGSLALTKGMARVVTSCAGLKTFVPANPVLQAVGAAILLGTVAYAIYKYPY